MQLIDILCATPIRECSERAETGAINARASAHERRRNRAVFVKVRGGLKGTTLERSLWVPLCDQGTRPAELS